VTSEPSDPKSQPDNADRETKRAAGKRIDRVNAWLSVGGAVPPEHYERFPDAGITHIVDLRQGSEVDADPTRLEALGIARLQSPVENQRAPTHAQLAEIADWIDARKDSGQVYVHCGGGFGRAAVIAAALLVKNGASVDDAVQQVRQARPEIGLNSEQMSWLHSVEQQFSAEKLK
jgi:protein-tyrosine phosphatase